MLGHSVIAIGDLTERFCKLSGMGNLTDISNGYTAGQEGNQHISRVEEWWKGGFGGNVLVKTFIAECRSRYKIQEIFTLKHLVAKHVLVAKTGTVANDIIIGKTHHRHSQ